MPHPLDHALLEDLLRFHSEGNSLDFKAIEYKKEQFPALLKDVLAMANSLTSDDRYILIGVKMHAGGTRTYDGITAPPMDAAILQQLVHENIEPELPIDYLPFSWEGHQLVALRLSACTNPPYLMKKNYATLEKGDGFIRKGSHQTRLSRADLDRMYAPKTTSAGVTDHHISILFEQSQQTTLALKALDHLALPSAAYQAEIHALLAFKEVGAYPRKEDLPIRKHYFPDTAYEHFTLDKLQADLARATKTYISEDHYYKFVEAAVPINFLLYNTGLEYVTDAILEISIPEIAGLKLASAIPSSNLHAPAFPTGPEPAPGEYRASRPSLRLENGQLILRQDLGELKRHLRTKAFHSEIPLFLPPSTAGHSLTITCTLYGKKLLQPIQKHLTLEIQPERE